MSIDIRHIMKSELGYSSTSISRVCNHKQAFHGKKGEDKYIWSFTPIEKKD